MIEQCVNMTADTLFYMDRVLVTGTVCTVLDQYCTVYSYTLIITNNQNTVVC